MSNALSRLASQALAVAILAGLLWGAYGLLASPVVSEIARLQDETETQRRLLGRYSSVPAGGEGAAAAPGAALAGDGPVFLPGSSDAIRVAGLQSLVGEVAEMNNAVVRSTRPLVAKEQDGLRLIGLEAQLTATIEQLQAMLHRLESGRPTLVIETLHILPPPTLGEGPSAGLLEIRLGLVGAADGKRG